MEVNGTTTLIYGALRQIQEERDIKTTELIAATAFVICGMAETLAQGEKNRRAAGQTTPENRS
jgi:hypothetical protein